MNAQLKTTIAQSILYIDSQMVATVILKFQHNHHNTHCNACLTLFSLAARKFQLKLWNIPKLEYDF